METARRILALIRKEFLALLKDKRSRTVVIIPPLLQTILFGYAATFDLVNVPVAVFDEDRSEVSRELIAGLVGSTVLHVREVASEVRMTELVGAREVVIAVRVPPDFAREMRSPAGAGIQIVMDGRNSNTAFAAQTAVAAVLEDFAGKWTKRHGGSLPRARVLSRAWFNPNLESRWFFVPGIVGLVTMTVTLLVTALSVAREREQGTFDQLLVAPYRPVDILVGKAAPGFLIGLVEATVIILLAVFWFEVPLRGSLVTLYAGLVLFLFSMVGVGLMLSSLSVTMQQGLLGTFLFMVPAVILSGFATPIANMSEPVQYLTYVNPIRYTLVILRSVFLEGAPLQLLLGQLWPLAAIGLACLTLAGWMFRHRIN